MLQVEQPQLIPVNEDKPAIASFNQGIDLAVGFLRRRYLGILVCLLLSMAAGALYLVLVPPTYTASAVMMMETHKGSIQTLLTDGQTDPAWIESQIGVLKSRNVAEYVVKQLRLADDPEFVGPGLLDMVLRRVGWDRAEPKSEAERTGD